MPDVDLRGLDGAPTSDLGVELSHEASGAGRWREDGACFIGRRLGAIFDYAVP